MVWTERGKEKPSPGRRKSAASKTGSCRLAWSRTHGSHPWNSGSNPDGTKNNRKTLLRISKRIESENYLLGFAKKKYGCFSFSSPQKPGLRHSLCTSHPLLRYLRTSPSFRGRGKLD